MKLAWDQFMVPVPNDDQQQLLRLLSSSSSALIQSINQALTSAAIGITVSSAQHALS